MSRFEYESHRRGIAKLERELAEEWAKLAVAEKFIAPEDQAEYQRQKKVAYMKVRYPNGVPG